MKARRTPSAPPKKLRTRAEQLLATTRREVPQMPVADAQKLVHELQVHQLELEMQNDELRRTQLELEAARDRYADLYDFAPSAHLTLNADGEILEANLNAGKLLGLERGRLIHQKLTRFIAAEAQDAFYLFCRQVCNTDGRQSADLDLVNAASKRLVVRVEAVREATSPRQQGRFSFIDITGRKQAEDALQVASQLNQQIIAGAKEGIIVYDRELKYQVWNPFMEEMTGVPADKVFGKHPLEVFPFLQATGVMEQLNGILAGKECATKEFRFNVPQSGRSGWASDTNSPLRNEKGEITGVIGIVRNITERKRAEEELRVSEARFAFDMKATQEGLWDWDVPSGRVYYSRAYYAMLGYAPGEHAVDFRSWLDLTHPEDRERAFQANQACIDWHSENFEVEFRMRSRSGDWKWIVAQGKAVARDPQGKATRLVGTHRDITMRKQAEQLLQNANRTLQAIRDCHEAMLRAKTERALLEDICRIIVQTGGERMAWVGFAERNVRKTVRSVASAGVSKDYLTKARITWADLPRGRGPVGTAIRTGKVSLCQNTLTDPNFAPWRAGARRNGYGSVIALPMMVEGQCIGALCIYAAEPEAFDIAEQLLLTDLANDLAFGISTLRLRAESERLEDEILKSVEREQERIGRDLHDGLCQLLVGAKFRSVYLQKISADKLPVAAREAKALEKALNHAIEQARDLSRGLNPVQVMPAGLTAALQKLADNVVTSRGPNCFCQFPEPVKISDHHVAYHLYRIAQEAVQNALKHARAKNISITLARQEGCVVLTVKDDGVGLARRRKKRGMGLHNMLTRARLFGGRLEIRRRKLGGTAVTCELPQPSVKQP